MRSVGCFVYLDRFLYDIAGDSKSGKMLLAIQNYFIADCFPTLGSGGL